MLIDAKEEEDLAGRDALLDELRKLASSHLDDATIREIVTGGLFNTLIDAKGEEDLARRDALLDELRKLTGNYPDDAAVRIQLAEGMYRPLYMPRLRII